ncbi:MAG: sugar transferase [Lentisphaerae bacterium]|nr:sugar transferase [Lentisphaerota bacterium]
MKEKESAQFVRDAGAGELRRRQSIIAEIYARGKQPRSNTLKLVLWDCTLVFARGLKRFLDIVGSLFMLLILLPLLLVVAILIKLEDGGSIIYRQVRVGKDGRHFQFYKFRSMYEDADRVREALAEQNQSADGVIFKMKRDPRVTRMGRFIRRFSIDELPQLFNVLAGDMSLVGPRPPLPDEVMQYTLEDRKRLHVMPGITCIWQVSGRSDIPFKQQVQLDKEYIHSQSLRKDLWILLKTIPAVIFGKGAY